MAIMVFNSQVPFVTNLGFTPEVGDWPVDDWKYADAEFVYSRTTDLVRRIIDTAPVSGRFKRVLIDVKVQDLTPNIYSCIPGWHLDGAFPEHDVEPDRHHLFVMNGPMTEFVAQPLNLDVSYIYGRRSLLPDMAGLLRQIPADVAVRTAAPNAITTFTSYDFHRGVKASAPTRRLLVRLTESNTVTPFNRPRAPSQGARAPRS